MSHNTNLSISGNTAQCNARQLFSLLQVGTIRTINLFSDGLGKSEIADFLELEENKKFNLPETHGSCVFSSVAVIDFLFADLKQNICARRGFRPV